ncbi:MAG: AmmeMemoRadiSam system protein A, partial [Planctomycetota bacterium]
ALPSVDPDGLSEACKEEKACFVTLHRGKELRGCIGHLRPSAPLYRAVMENARAAALKDRRFPPVRPEEVDELTIEISVLDAPVPLERRPGDEADVLSRIVPGECGVILRKGTRCATLLPQVWAVLPDPAVFLDRLSQKAGLPSDAWKDPTVQLEVYHVEAFTQGPTACDRN